MSDGTHPWKAGPGVPSGLTAAPAAIEPATAEPTRADRLAARVGTGELERLVVRLSVYLLYLAGVAMAVGSLVAAELAWAGGLVLVVAGATPAFILWHADHRLRHEIELHRAHRPEPRAPLTATPLPPRTP